MLYYSYTHTRFHLVYCIVAIVIVCHFVQSLMEFVSQEIKGLLTYLPPTGNALVLGNLIDIMNINIHVYG